MRFIVARQGKTSFGDAGGVGEQPHPQPRNDCIHLLTGDRMSVRWMSHVWEHSAQSGNALLVLLAIADHANDDGVCWPSIARIAAKARISERQTKRIIAGLEDAGELAVERGDGRSHTSVYRLKGDKAMSLISGTEKGDKSRIKGDKSGQKGDKSSIKGDIAMSPEPSIEPSIEPSGNHHHAAAPHGDENAAMLGNVYAAWQDNIGMVGPIVSGQIKDLVDEVGARSVIHGITIAAQNNKRAFNYVQSCARNHANGTSPTYRNGTSANRTSKVARSMDAVDRVFAQLQEAK